MPALPIEVVCPSCHSVLIVDAKELICPRCQKSYGVGSWGGYDLVPPGTLDRDGALEKSGRDREAASYESQQRKQKTPFFLKLERTLVLRSLRELPAGAILEVGCGTGQTTIALQRLHRAVVASDFSPQSLEILAEKGIPDVTLIGADASALPFPDCSFAAIVAVGVVGHMPAPARERALREFHRCLVPSGVLVLTAFNAARFRAEGTAASGHFGSGIPYHSWDANGLRALAHAGGFETPMLRPYGVFLLLQHLRVRGSWSIYRLGSPVLNAIEGWVHPLLPPNLSFPSVYWIMSARKTA